MCARADAARANGQIGDPMELGRQAAFRLDVVEQRRLEDMWDDPLLKASAKANSFMLFSGLEGCR